MKHENYRELMERYRSGTATEEERSRIENDLEKYAVLTEYYAEHDDLLDGGEELPPADMKAVKELIRASRRRSRITACKWLAVIIGLLLLYNFAYLPLVNHFVYYDPTEISYEGQQTTDLQTELATLVDLHVPAIMSSNLTVTETGAGQYTFFVPMLNLFTYESVNFSGKVKNGQFYYDNPFAFTTDFDYAPRHGGLYAEPHAASWPTLEESLADLDKLPSYANCLATVSFHRDLTMQEFLEMRFNTGVYSLWLAIRNIDEADAAADDGDFYPAIGFNCFEQSHGGDGVDADYPYYNFENQAYKADSTNAERYERHFLALLDYQLDHGELACELSSAMVDKAYYQRVKDYVDERGVLTTGVVVYGNPEAIRKFCASEDVCALDISEIKMTN